MSYTNADNLTLVEAGKILKVGPAAVRRLISEGALQAFSVGRQLRVPASKLNAFIEAGCEGNRSAKRFDFSAGTVLQ